MIYTIKIKQKGQWFFRKYKAKGHGLTNNRFAIDLEDGGLIEFPDFSSMTFCLCAKWRQMELEKANKEAGQKIV